MVTGGKDWPCAMVAGRKDPSRRGQRQFGVDERRDGLFQHSKGESNLKKIPSGV
jgi:hypothetical protein